MGQWGDPDFEPGTLFDQLWSGARLPPRLGRFAGHSAAALTRAAGLFASRITVQEADRAGLGHALPPVAGSRYERRASA